MTVDEREEAIEIMETYRGISKDLEEVLKLLSDLETQKDFMIERLENLKKKELDFMSTYREKYGDRNILEDLKWTG